jgi:hypothetical protein
MAAGKLFGTLQAFGEKIGPWFLHGNTIGKFQIGRAHV